MTRHSRGLRLGRAAYLVVLAAALVIFYAGAGSAWQHPTELDAALFYSYAAIPVLVIAAALLTRRVSWRGVVLDSVEIAVVKFGLTYAVAFFASVIATTA